MENTKKPLAAFKVVELATVVAAPVTARLMADYGADVYKIETPPFGEGFRDAGNGHFLPSEPGNSPLYDVFNSGKKHIVIDLKKAEGMDAFYKLLEDADVFITNVRMQSLTKMGIDYDGLKERFPKLIYGHLSGFGLTGEEMNRPGYDTTAFWTRSGAVIDMNVPGSFPVRPSFAFGDIATASAFLSGILIGLLGRETTGHGTLVSTSLQKSGVWCNTTSILNAQEPYNREYPVDRYYPWSPLNDFYCCSDGEWLVFCQKRAYELDRLVFAKVLDIPEMAEDPDMESSDKLRETGKIKTLVALIEAKMKEKTYPEWKQIFDDNDVAYEHVVHFKDVCKDKQARAIGCFDDVEYPGGVVTAVPTPPFDFSEYARNPFRKSPAPGTDTKEILSKLGYTEAEIAVLYETKAVL